MKDKMQEIRAVSLETTSASLQEVFGFVSNLFRLQTRLPRVVHTETGIARALLVEEWFLSSRQKTYIIQAIAADFRNAHSLPAHHQMLLSLGAPGWRPDQIVFDFRQAELSKPDRALIEFAPELAASKPWLSGRDIAALWEHGCSDEAILITALLNLLATRSAALDPSPDFESRAISYRQHVSPPDGRAYVGSISGIYLPFASFLQRSGFSSDSFRAQTFRPDAIKLETDLVHSVLLPADFLSRFRKKCIFWVGSAVNLRPHCGAVHCGMLRAMGAPAEDSGPIAGGNHAMDISKKNMELLDLAVKLSGRRLAFKRKDIEALRSGGFSNEHVPKSVVAIAFSNFFHPMQISFGVKPDLGPAFQPQETEAPVAADGPIEGIKLDPDAELVTRVQDGDLDAFEELVNRHRGRVYRALVGIIGNHEEARDAMQDTFLKAFEHIGTFERRSKFSTWLLAIAGNRGLQRLRERRPLERIDDLADGAGFHSRQLAASHADPEQLYSLDERRRLVKTGLMKVPSIYRAVLVLRDLEQLSNEEAAAALGLGIPALKARLFRGRMMLRKALSSHFESDAAKVGS